jgi:hypothetical protein
MSETRATIKVLAKGLRIDERLPTDPAGTKSGVNGCGSAGECVTISPEPEKVPLLNVSLR